MIGELEFARDLESTGSKVLFSSSIEREREREGNCVFLCLFWIFNSNSLARANFIVVVNKREE